MKVKMQVLRPLESFVYWNVNISPTLLLWTDTNGINALKLLLISCLGHSFGVVFFQAHGSKILMWLLTWHFNEIFVRRLSNTPLFFFIFWHSFWPALLALGQDLNLRDNLITCYKLVFFLNWREIMDYTWCNENIYVLDLLIGS